MIVVYSKPNCPHCENAKTWLTNYKFTFDVVDITENTSAKDFLVAQGHRTVPQIYSNNGKLLVEGGYSVMTQLGPEILRERIENAI